MILIDGKSVANQIQQEIKSTVDDLIGRKPGLTVLLVGDNPASQVYVRMKQKACQMVGIISSLLILPTEITEKQLLQKITLLNQDSSVDGILIQMPLPKHIDSHTIMQTIDPKKDVDGFHPLNMGKMLLGDTSGFYPCTPYGIKVLLDYYRINVAGQHLVILGRSNIVGKPLAAILMQNQPGCNATVTIANQQTKNLPSLCQSADILVAAMGRPRFVTSEMVKEGATVIDVGISRIEHPDKKGAYTLVGDVDFENVHNKCAYITPVPGGVGPMTIAMLLKNTLLSFQRRSQ